MEKLIAKGEINNLNLVMQFEYNDKKVCITITETEIHADVEKDGSWHNCLNESLKLLKGE